MLTLMELEGIWVNQYCALDCCLYRGVTVATAVVIDVVENAQRLKLLRKESLDWM